MNGRARLAANASGVVLSIKHNFLVTPNFSLTTDECADLFHKALGTLQGFINTNEDLVSK
jgi:hypothetical protein